jgi:hypothetical protein
MGGACHTGGCMRGFNACAQGHALPARQAAATAWGPSVPRVSASSLPYAQQVHRFTPALRALYPWAKEIRQRVFYLRARAHIIWRGRPTGEGEAQQARRSKAEPGRVCVYVRTCAVRFFFKWVRKPTVAGVAQ